MSSAAQILAVRSAPQRLAADSLRSSSLLPGDQDRPLRSLGVQLPLAGSSETRPSQRSRRRGKRTRALAVKRQHARRHATTAAFCRCGDAMGPRDYTCDACELRAVVTALRIAFLLRRVSPHLIDLLAGCCFGRSVVVSTGQVSEQRL